MGKVSQAPSPYEGKGSQQANTCVTDHGLGSSLDLLICGSQLFRIIIPGSITDGETGDKFFQELKRNQFESVTSTPWDRPGS